MCAAFVDVVWEDGVPDEDLDAGGLQALLQDVLAEEGAQGEVTVILTDDAQLLRLNRSFRNVDAPTDVLSFDLRDDEGPEIGEIYISVERAKAQASERGRSLSDEVDLLAVHGALHLMGFDHDTDEAHQRMREREQHHLTTGVRRDPAKGE